MLKSLAKLLFFDDHVNCTSSFEPLVSNVLENKNTRENPGQVLQESHIKFYNTNMKTVDSILGIRGNNASAFSSPLFIRPIHIIVREMRVIWWSQNVGVLTIRPHENNSDRLSQQRDIGRYSRICREFDHPAEAIFVAGHLVSPSLQMLLTNPESNKTFTFEPTT